VLESWKEVFFMVSECPREGWLKRCYETVYEAIKQQLKR
jgi:hypothetical protein